MNKYRAFEHSASTGHSTGDGNVLNIHPSTWAGRRVASCHTLSWQKGRGSNWKRAFPRRDLLAHLLTTPRGGDWLGARESEDSRQTGGRSRVGGWGKTVSETDRSWRQEQPHRAGLQAESVAGRGRRALREAPARVFAQRWSRTRSLQKSKQSLSTRRNSLTAFHFLPVVSYRCQVWL